MNLFTKQEESQMQKTNLWLRGVGINGEIGINIYALLYSTSLLNTLMTYVEKEYLNPLFQICITDALGYTPETNTTL